jgi:hypothetical protein
MHAFIYRSTRYPPYSGTVSPCTNLRGKGENDMMWDIFRSTNFGPVYSSSTPPAAFFSAFSASIFAFNSSSFASLQKYTLEINAKKLKADARLTCTLSLFLTRTRAPCSFPVGLRGYQTLIEDLVVHLPQKNLRQPSRASGNHCNTCLH